MDILHLDLNQCYTNSLICDTPFALSMMQMTMPAVSERSISIHFCVASHSRLGR
ncbi:MAG: hypothetical protein J5990_01780 [Bacteroidales bacterium]|nr:hypothetical protein [Bacteroidales bacterium]